MHFFLPQKNPKNDEILKTALLVYHFARQSAVGGSEKWKIHCLGNDGPFGPLSPWFWPLGHLPFRTVHQAQDMQKVSDYYPFTLPNKHGVLR